MALSNVGYTLSGLAWPIPLAVPVTQKMLTLGGCEGERAGDVSPASAGESYFE